MQKPRKKLYIGCKVGKREVFRHHETPTFSSHGGQYNAVIGPFRTKAAALFMADPQTGTFNPHCQTVADAERLAKIHKNKFVVA